MIVWGSNKQLVAVFVVNILFIILSFPLILYTNYRSKFFIAEVCNIFWLLIYTYTSSIFICGPFLRYDNNHHHHLIGHFRVAPSLCFKTSLSAKPLIWKWLFVLMQIKLIFPWKILHLASFWKWEFLERGNGLLNSLCKKSSKYQDSRHVTRPSLVRVL